MIGKIIQLFFTYLQFQYQFLMQKSISKPQQMKAKINVGSKHKNAKNNKINKINISFTKIQKTNNEMLHPYDSKSYLNTSSFQQLQYHQQMSVSQNLQKRTSPIRQISQLCMQDKLNNYMNKLIQLTSVNGYIHQKLEKTEQKNLELHISLRKSEEINEKLKQQNINLNNQYQKLKAQIRNKENELSNKQLHHNSIIKQYDNKILIFSNQNDALLQKIHNISATNQIQKNQLKQQINKLTQQNVYSVQDKQNIVKQLLNIKSTFLDEIKSQKQQNQCEIAIKNKKILQLSNTIHQRQIHIVNLENNFVEIQNMRQTLQRNNQILVQQVNRFKKRQIQFYDQKLRYESIIKKNDMTISQLKLKLEQAQINKLELQNKFIKIDFRRESLEKQISKQNQNTKNALKKIQIQLNQKNIQLQVLEKQVIQIKDQNKLLKQNINDKQDRLSQITNHMHKKQKELQNLQLKLQQIKAENQLLIEQKNKVIDHVQNYYDKISKLQLYISLQNKIRIGLEQKITLLQKQIRLRQARFKQLQHSSRNQSSLKSQSKQIIIHGMQMRQSKLLMSQKRIIREDKIHLISKSSIYEQVSYYQDSNKHSNIQLLKNDGVQNELSMSIVEIGRNQSIDISEDILKQQESNFEEKKLKYFR